MIGVSMKKNVHVEKKRSKIVYASSYVIHRIDVIHWIEKWYVFGG